MSGELELSHGPVKNPDLIFQVTPEAQEKLKEMNLEVRGGDIFYQDPRMLGKSLLQGYPGKINSFRVFCLSGELFLEVNDDQGRKVFNKIYPGQDGYTSVSGVERETLSKLYGEEELRRIENFRE